MKSDWVLWGYMSLPFNNIAGSQKFKWFLNRQYVFPFYPLAMQIVLVWTLCLIEYTCRVDVDSSDESDMEDDIDQPAVVKTKHHDLMMKGEGNRKGSFFKQAKKSYPMFPSHEERIKWDEYGEIIR